MRLALLTPPGVFALALCASGLLLNCAHDPPATRGTAGLPAVAASNAAGTAAASAAPSSTQPALPATPKRPVVDDYSGTKVTDDYRWLEDAHSPEVKAWSEAQNHYTRALIDALPGRDGVKQRLAGLMGDPSAVYFELHYRAGHLFAMKRQPPQQQSVLVALQSPDDTSTARVVVDPNQIDPSGKTTIDMYVPSLDGKLVAVSLSQGGSESGDVHVYDVATGKERGDVIPRAHTGTSGGSVAWNTDASGFYYTRHWSQGERPAEDLDFFEQIYFHKLGTPPSADAYAIGKDFPRIAEIELSSSDDGKYTLARVANGDGGEFAFYLAGPSGAWTQFAQLSDKVIQAQFGRDNGIYLVSRKDTPRGKILRVTTPSPSLAKATVVVAASDAVIEGIEATPSHLYVTDLVGGPSQVRVFGLAHGTTSSAPPVMLPIAPVSSVSQVLRLDGESVLFHNASYTQPAAWYRYDPAAGAKRTALFQTSPADFADTEVLRETCVSKDGTSIPMTILRRKGTKLDGTNPTLVYGYGGYGISERPRFRPDLRVWLDQGGVYVDVNLRGGGEFGEDWHAAGNLTRKQNVFDDFAAAAQAMMTKGYTNKDKLAIMGGSNGGLLMGAELTQHPAMFRAVVSAVGIYDMLRVELAPNGAFNVTEFGTVKDPEQWKALSAYSPYQHVTDGVAYPAVLFLTGANDPRVDPYHSRKMTARLQAATSSGLPVLLRTSDSTGHGMGTPLSAQIEERADIYSFLFAELGVAVSNVQGPAR